MSGGLTTYPGNAAGSSVVSIATANPGILVSPASGTGAITLTLGELSYGDLWGGSFSPEGSATLAAGNVPYWNGTNWVPQTVSGAVTSVSNSDGTLTISPTTGAVVASIALGHANSWTAAQTFAAYGIKLLGSNTGATTFASANSSATNYTATFPACSGTVNYSPRPTQFGPTSPGSITLTSNILYYNAGLGSTIKYTPAFSGSVMITLSGTYTQGTSGRTYFVQFNYGTGTAPAKGTTTTVSTQACAMSAGVAAGGGNTTEFCVPVLITGLAVGTAYWFDLQVLSNTSSDTFSINEVMCQIWETP